MAYVTGIMPMKQVHKPPFTIEAPGYERVPGETLPRRHPKAKDGLLTTPAEGVKTVFDIVGRSAKKYPEEPAVGTRKLIQMHKEMKKIKKQYFELTPYSYMTFKEFETLVLQLGAGLRKLGLNAGDRLHIFATTR
jgi:long-chain acyl-CoA synthetase